MFGWLNGKKSLCESGLLTGAIDNHCHVLWGVDDGVKTQEESLAILKFLETLGMDTLWLTPHIMEDVPNTTADLRLRFEELKSVYTGNIKLHLSAENMMDTLFEERLEKGDLLMHGDNKVLVETSTWAPPINFWDIIDTMFVKGYVPILAHPERYRYMDDREYRRLYDAGVIFQLNIPSLIGVYGESVRKKAENMLFKNMYCMAGSDCHRFRAIENQYGNKVFTKKILNALEALMCN
ncbi:MAG: tyrosine-protein phosphatase [Candidatus Cryptobacteroides sp.]